MDQELNFFKLATHNERQSLAALSMARLSHTQQLELAVVFRFLAGAYKVMCILHKVGECECE